MNLEVTGHRVLLKMNQFDTEVKEGALAGFKLDVGDDWRRERAATQLGEVIQIGPMAWRSFDGDDPNWKPWAKVGDVVYFAKYAYKTVMDGDDEYIIVNDEDIQCIVHNVEVAHNG